LVKIYLETETLVTALYFTTINATNVYKL